jgi:hypothetical protein
MDAIPRRARLAALLCAALALSVMFVVSPAASNEANAAVSNYCSGNVAGDYAHISTSSPRQAVQGHGYWYIKSGSCTKANISVQVQMKKSFLFVSYWSNVGKAPVSTVSSGGSSSNRATGHYDCANATTYNSFRTVVSGTLVKPANYYTISSGQATTAAQTLRCG